MVQMMVVPVAICKDLNKPQECWDLIVPSAPIVNDCVNAQWARVAEFEYRKHIFDWGCQCEPNQLVPPEATFR